MKITELKYIIIFSFLVLILGQPSAQENPAFVLNPRFQKIEFPAREFAWIDNDQFPDSCTAVADSMWMRLPADSLTLMVAVTGPHGSGRYWTVTIGIGGTGKNKPDRGICLTTTTIGWRTLQQFSTLPLPWLGDLDDDDMPELIIWDSFPLSKKASPAEFGLIAWVYELNLAGELEINWLLSRQMIAEIATAYRQALKNADKQLQQRRNEIAVHLENFVLKK